MYPQYFKRLLDLILGLILLVFLFPIFLVLSLLIVLFLGRPIFFKQQRPGLNQKPFYIYKFRTLKNLYDEHGQLLEDRFRMSRFGRLLRSLSLDEIPEILNVIRGDMSFVGPRPLLMEYLPFYTPEEQKRHQVKPGITGWAQINGRNALSWPQKFDLDIWYVEHISLLLDLKIFILTFFKILKREGIQAINHVTMPRLDHERQSIRE